MSLSINIFEWINYPLLGHSPRAGSAVASWLKGPKRPKSDSRKEE